MQNFTAAGLTALLVRVVEARDPALAEGVARPDPMARAVVPDAVKRMLIDRVLERHGPGPLLAVGRHLDRVDETPVHTVLLRSGDPAVLAEKWRRLERYLHSSHRVAIEARERSWSCLRTSTGGPPPTFGENCLIAGLLFGLLGRIGCEGLRLGIGGLEFDSDALETATLPEAETAEAFRFEWSRDAANSAPEPSAAVGGPVDDSLTDLLASDLGRGWTVAEAARRLAFSKRSLQRRLADEGRSFSSVLRRARMREATELLTRGEATLAEIGYCCGYADQAHFQRDFLRATNLTPRRFRELNALRASH